MRALVALALTGCTAAVGASAGPTLSSSGHVGADVTGFVAPGLAEDPSHGWLVPVRVGLGLAAAPHTMEASASLGLDRVSIPDPRTWRDDDRGPVWRVGPHLGLRTADHRTSGDLGLSLALLPRARLTHPTDRDVEHGGFDSSRYSGYGIELGVAFLFARPSQDAPDRLLFSLSFALEKGLVGATN
jgi:hypothetical protein